jgi:hypothetical protein
MNALRLRKLLSSHFLPIAMSLCSIAPLGNIVVFSHLLTWSYNLERLIRPTAGIVKPKDMVMKYSSITFVLLLETLPIKDSDAFLAGCRV